MLAADTTRVVAVGISLYADPGLCLEYAAADAEKVVDALKLQDASAIPSENVTLISDRQASRHAILNALAAVSGRCHREDIFIFFFSGHGDRAASQFYLLPSDVERASPSTSAISVADLETAVSACKARGILFILDCCLSAGFAENAGTYFTTIPDQDFKLLLSASRAGQNSYEFESSKGTIFAKRLVEVLRGEAAIGDKPGVVYFSDLFEYLQLQIAEDLEARGFPRTSQEPIFAGTYSKDPRLFVLKRLSLETLEAETPLYSRKFLRRRLWRALLSVGFTLIAALAFYYSYLDHSTYVWHETNLVENQEGDYLAIYTGDPNLNWLGFPHRIIVTDLPTSAFSSAVRPGVGSPLRSPLSLQIEPSLFSQLSPEWKTVASVWRNDKEGAFKFAKELDVVDEPAPGTQQAVESLALIAQTTDLSALEDVITPDEVNISVPGLRRIAWLDPDRAISDLANQDFGMTGETFDDPKEQRAVLEGLPSRCDPKISVFLSKRASHAEENSYEHDAWYGALLRTGCSIPESTLRTLLEKPGFIETRQLDILPYLAVKKPEGVFKFLQRQLTTLIAQSQNPADDSDADYKASLLMWRDLRLLTVVFPALVPDESSLLLVSPYKHVRFAAARALLAKNPRNEKLLVDSFLSDPWIDSALIDAGWFSELQLSHALMPLAQHDQRTARNFYSASIMYLLRTIRFRHPQDAQGFAEAVLSNFHQPEVRIEAERTLAALKASGAEERRAASDVGMSQSVKDSVGSDPKTISESRYVFMRGTFDWYFQHDPRAFKGFLLDPGDDPDEATEVLGKMNLSDTALAVLRKELQQGRSRLKAAAVLAMRGRVGDLETLLRSPDANLRNEAMLYAAYNPLLESNLDRLVSSDFRTQTHSYLAGQLELKRELKRQINGYPKLLRGLVLRVVAIESPTISPGLVVWIDNQLDEIEADTVDWPQEIAPDNSPPPIVLAKLPNQFTGSSAHPRLTVWASGGQDVPH